ncbi:LSU ribosomal protein L9P [Desulfobotulus alkaliphilus]|uniref:Large ribosomal subunit protein bL9 n=1 Tax=Desulfobotulus alkaliphilus TaxID=622671 RepID=A0A562S7J1_9BACT|nr:50S ribosomal protein L9 [Desulfobotulus alkaliphilus]TWI77382.1 LSU ribosomal protein L9P [Desulfobotulus alkaliphilus]
MKVILKETIESLGIIGSEVNVADGYARNYLLPQKKAILATPQNRKVMEQMKVRVQAQIAKERAIAEELAARLNEISVTLSAKVADEGKLYGSVTVQDIVRALLEQNVEVERRQLLLPEPIKALGTYKVPVRVYKGVEPEITVEVVPAA